MIVKLLGGSDKINGMETDVSIYGGEIRVRERIDDIVGGQYVIHAYKVFEGEAYWYATDFLGRRKRILKRMGKNIEPILMYDRVPDPPTEEIVKQLKIELAKNKPVTPEIPNESERLL